MMEPPLPANLPLVSSLHHGWLMMYRPMSQFLRSNVIPEVRARVARGEVSEDALPLPVYQFLWLQTPGRIEVRINDEAAPQVKARPLREITPGQAITTEDVDIDDCQLVPFTVNDQPAAYYFCSSLFLNFVALFDFEANAPRDAGETFVPASIRFPLGDLVRAHRFTQVIKPVQGFARLAEAHWPPGPEYYPHVLAQVHTAPENLANPEFAEVVAASYNPQFLRERAAFWAETNLFGARTAYVTKAIEEYIDGDFVSAIYILVPQFEGIVKSYLETQVPGTRYRFESCLADLRALILSRPILMFPREVLHLIFEFLENSTFLQETSKIHDPSAQVTRHGIAHGRFAGFETQAVTLKYLVLMDALAYVLLHDKLITEGI